MADLRTTFMGLQLKNPLVAASCSLTGKLETIQALADHGVGAVVLKSLFEEQMDAETRALEHFTGSEWHTEAHDYVQNMGMELGPNQYLQLLETAKQKVSVPVIASLNCVSERWWPEYAKKLEKHGADALELNISHMTLNPAKTSKEVEQVYHHVVEKLSAQVNIPFAVKIGPKFTNLAGFARDLHRHGAQALVLFNRYVQVDIDIDRIEFKAGSRFSSPAELGVPLRWVALLAENVECELASTTGVHDAAGLIKMLLAGAQVVQVSSAFYNHGASYAATLIKGLEAWMESKGFASIDAFRGQLSRAQGSDTEMLDRLQYIKALVGIE